MNLTDLISKINGDRLVSRFAPSPTGDLHLGHVAHCIYVWGLTKTVGGEINFRIEDHDQQRSATKYAKKILHELEWLGFVPDKGYHINSDRNYLQSCQAKTYQNQLDKLMHEGVAYKCNCSRKDLRTRIKSNDQAYDGHCRNRGLGSVNCAVRLKIARNKNVEFFDVFSGRNIEVIVKEGHDDIILLTKEGNYSYNFAVVLDDLRQGVNLVIRGLDILPLTGVQLVLRELISNTNGPIVYAHHPLLYGDKNKQKLSKSNQDKSVSSMRQEGMSASEIIGMAAYQLGLIEEHVNLHASEVKGLFKI